MSASGGTPYDNMIGRAATLGELEALAGLTPETRVGFWLDYAGIEPEAERLAAGIAELKRRIRRSGPLA